MEGQQRALQGLAVMPPGPGLAGALAGIDPSGLSGFEAVELLRAQQRQLNHDRARLLTTMVEVGLAEEADRVVRGEVPGEFAADEIRAGLVLTRRAVEDQLELAYDLRTRLPAVHAAMEAGWCDAPRARVLSEWTTGLSGARPGRCATSWCCWWAS